MLANCRNQATAKFNTFRFRTSYTSKSAANPARRRFLLRESLSESSFNPLSRECPIGDYAIVGDCRSAALVSKAGSIDWLCLPRFDSPSIFANLLDPDDGGRFAICPHAPFDVTRRYIGQSNILETPFTTQTGMLRLTDMMPVASEADKARELFPDHEILRKVECLEGTVNIDVFFDPRPDYARGTPRLLECSTLGCFYEYGAQILALRSDVPLETSAAVPGLIGHAMLRSGDLRYLSMTFAHGYPAVVAPLGEAADTRITRSIGWWQIL